MSEFAITIEQCPHCNRRFWNEVGWKLHKEVCDKDPKVLAAAEKFPGLVALSPQEMAEREAGKGKPFNTDWQEIDKEILEEEAREAIRAMETPKVEPLPEPKKSRKKPAEVKPVVDLTSWT